MHNTRKIMLILFSLLMAQGATAAETTAATPLSPNKEHISAPYQMPDTTLVRDYCPPVEALIQNKEKQSWGTTTGWRTTSPSLLYSLDLFVGAQWVGVSVGQIICIYTKTGRNAFPVDLQQGKVVPAPHNEGQWSADKGGYMECKSHDPHDCGFLLPVPHAPKNMYDEIDFYKGKPTESS